MLGLKRGTIKLVDHNPRWVEAFDAEVALLKYILGESYVAAEHIGSTAIPGIQAKPILDMQVAVPEMRDVERYHEALLTEGYDFRGSPHERDDHILYAKGPEECRTIYLKFTTLGSKFWTEHILFRDYLINNRDAAREYERLKQSLAQELPEDQRAIYTERKTQFVFDILDRASKAT